ncbi:MAG: cadherin-like beta sandwich domain-containing protein [Spirochaetales bacterium]|nr:cadherin-like beta sandwich domain-containing protein [Spirochaetales bacterium]
MKRSILTVLAAALFAVAFIAACTAPVGDGGGGGSTTWIGTGIKVAYVTDSTNAGLTYPNDTVIYPALVADAAFDVLAVDAGSADLATICGEADVVYCSEIPKSDNTGWATLEGFNKPMLFNKVYAYKETVWNWATTGYGDNGTATNIVLDDPGHAIFTGLSGTTVPVLSAVGGATPKGISYMNPASFTGGPTVSTLAHVDGAASQVSILEIDADVNMNGTVLPQKFLQFAINGESYANVTADGVTIIKNSIYYLATGTVPGFVETLDGTITVSLSGAGANDTQNLLAMSVSPEATGLATITGGVASFALSTDGGATDYVYSGGANITIRAFIDVDDSGGTEPNAGDLVYVSPTPVVVDGNMTVNLTLSDFTTYVLSTDATLSNLTLSTSTLVSTGTYTYTGTAGSFDASATVTPTANDANATIQVQVNSGGYSSVTSGAASGSLDLNEGANTIEVLVTAEDPASTLTYTITVTRTINYGDMTTGLTNYQAAVVTAAGTGWSYDTGTMTITGAGDTGSTAEAMNTYWATKAVTGDFVFTVRLVTQGGAGSSNHARSGLVAASAATAADVSGTNYYSVIRYSDGTGIRDCRYIDGSGSNSSNIGSDFTIPKYLRLRRVGNTFYGETSADGSTWATRNRTEVFPATVYIGFFVSSGVNDGTAVATFDNISLIMP